MAYYRYSSSLTPDVWFDAAKVWEVKCADLSLSPHHHAAIGLVREELNFEFELFLILRLMKEKEYLFVFLDFYMKEKINQLKMQQLLNKLLIFIGDKRRLKKPMQIVKQMMKMICINY